MPGRSHYFDCNATTPTLPAAASAALEAMNTLFGNPSSGHVVGLQARHILESARARGAEVIGGRPDQLIFTSGATEAIQTAIFSALETAKARGISPGKNRLLYGATEHKAVPEALSHWVSALSLPLEVVRLPVDSRGQIVLDELRRHLQHSILVCTMAVNNETGVIQDLEAIERCLTESGSDALWLVDCVQALGKLPLRLASSRIDYAPFSGHKIYAPKGIGFLFKSDRAPLVPLIVGGGQERGLRSGTENLPGVAALGAVLDELSKRDYPASVFQGHDKLVELRDRLVDGIRGAFPNAEFNTPFGCSVPTTINFSVPGFSSGELMDVFDSAGLRLSAGSACSSQSVKPSHVLEAMGIPEWRSVSALRLSFGPCTSSSEVDGACLALREAAQALRNSCLLATGGGFEPPEHLRDGILQFRSGPANTWVIADRELRTCVIIDPLDAVAERIESWIRCHDLKVLAVLETHSHRGQVSLRPVFEKILGARLLAQSADALGWPSQGVSQVRIGTQSDTKIAWALKVGPTQALVRVSCAGHTPDSVAYLLGTMNEGQMLPGQIQFVFSGDSFLSPSLGRSNLEVSDVREALRSMRQIALLTGERALICPAHDYQNGFATQIASESRSHRLVGLALSDRAPSNEEFGALLQESLAAADAMFEADESAGGSGVGALISIRELRELAGRDKLLVIDVREPQEHLVSSGWQSLGLKNAPRNVPLSRFVNLMQELVTGGVPADLPIVLLCRSGARSLQAAISLRRLGFARSRSLEGGLALATL